MKRPIGGNPFSLAPALALLVMVQAVSGQKLFRSGLGDVSPDMSGVPDVLHGKTTLLPQDDAGLLVTSWNQAEFQFVPFDSSNSSFAQKGTVDTGLISTELFSSSSVASSSASGRMFNTGNDVVISLGEGYDNHPNSPGYRWEYSYWNPSSGQQRGAYNLNRALYPNANTIYTKVIMGDFQGDNLQSALMFAESDFGGYVLWQMNIVAALNPNQVDDIDPNGGGPVVSGDASPAQAPVSTTIVAGDFNQDGIDEIAVLLRDGQTVLLYTVNPKTLQISPWQTIKLPAALTNPTLAAGRFNSSPNVVLAAIGQSLGNQNITVDYIDPITNSQHPSVTIVPTTFSVPKLDSSVFTGVFAQSAPLYNTGLNSLEQLVLGLAYESGSWHALLIGTFDNSYKFNLQEATGYQGCLLGMDVGNFNNQDSSGNVDPNLQIGLFKNFGGNSQCVPPFANGPLYIEMRNVAVPQSVEANPQAPPIGGPANWLDTLPRTELVPNLGDYNQLRLVPSFLIGDFQGRSERLGTPEHVTLMGHIQPNFVLGMPPMHVDWLQPFGGTGDSCETGTSIPGEPECILNLDVAPYGASSDKTDAFSSALSITQTSGVATSRKSTSSWGLAAKVTEGVKTKFGIPLEASGSFSITASVGNAYNSVKSEYESQYSTKSETLTTHTAFDDEVFFTVETQNFYNYPILGKVDKDNNQVYATFSVPSAVTIAEGGGSAFDWYQPVHEPGNVLSYPGSATALAQEYKPGSISQQASSGCLVVGSTDQTKNVSWNTKNQQDVSSGWTDALSENVNVSASGSVGQTVFSDGASVKISTDIDVSGSQAWGALNQSVNTDTSNQAVFLTVPPFDKTAAGKFAYGFASYVFGTSNAVLPYQSSNDLLPNNLNISTSGPLFVGFIADLQSQSCQGGQGSQDAKSFWTDAYNQPDVGFNHPDRWDVHTTNVASFNSAITPSAENPLISQSFYRMKGLFVTTGGAANGSAELGAGTVQSVPAGQSIWLTARVYNFSLVSTDQANPGSTVHVRFYAQKRCLVNYSDGVATDLCPNGAFQIRGSGRDGDVILAAIPGFSETPGERNWTMASVNFDTTGFDNAELVFWAVTWIEDASGNVISETPDHGVKLQSFAGKAFRNITDIPVEAHSNNVGFYSANHPFYVAPAIAPSVGDGNGTPESQEPLASQGPLQYIDLSFSSRTFRVDRVTHFTARFQAGEFFPGSTVLYFDGDPVQQGKLFDVQTVHSLLPGASTEHLVNFRAQRCGPHTIYAVSEPEGLPVRMGRISAEATINPADEVEGMIAYVKELHLNAYLERTLLANLSAAEKRFKEGDRKSGLAALKVFADLVQLILSQSNNHLFEQVNALLGNARLIQSCEAQLQ